MFSVLVDGDVDGDVAPEGSPGEGSPACCAKAPRAEAAPAIDANGQIVANLGALLQKLIAAMPTLLPEILQLIALFGKTQTTPPAAS